MSHLPSVVVLNYSLITEEWASCSDVNAIEGLPLINHLLPTLPWKIIGAFLLPPILIQMYSNIG